MIPIHKCREAMHYTTAWAVSKKKWDTKEDKGKSMMRALCIVVCQKGMSLDEVTSDSEKIKPVALAINELCFGIRQSVSRKFH